MMFRLPKHIAGLCTIDRSRYFLVLLRMTFNKDQILLKSNVNSEQKSYGFMFLQIVNMRNDGFAKWSKNCQIQKFSN